MSRQKKGNKKTPLYAFGKIVAQPVVRPFIPYRVKGWENAPAKFLPNPNDVTLH